MPQVLVAFGGALITIALFLWAEGSGWGLVIAWVIGTWGATMVAWGLLGGWYRSRAACVVASAFALAALLVALLCAPHPGLERQIMCAVASGLALIFGVIQIVYLSRRRT